MQRLLFIASLFLACLPARTKAVTVQVNPGAGGTTFTSRSYVLSDLIGTRADGSLLDLTIEFADPFFLEFDLDDSAGGTPGIFLNATIGWDSIRGISDGNIDEADAALVVLGGFPLVNSNRGLTTHQRDLGGDVSFSGANWLFADYPDLVQFDRIKLPITLPTGGQSASAFQIALSAGRGNRISVKTLSGMAGDLNDNELLDAGDIDMLRASILVGTDELTFDLDGSGMVDEADVIFLVEVLMGTRFGDADLNGGVTASGDGAILLANLGGVQQTKGWASGDFNGDRHVTASRDGAILLANLTLDVAAVPEPGSLVLTALALVAVAARRRSS